MLYWLNVYRANLKRRQLYQRLGIPFDETVAVDDMEAFYSAP